MRVTTGRAAKDVAQLAEDVDRLEVVDDEMALHLRSLSGTERLRIASGMYASARRMLRSHLVTNYPDWDEERLRDEMARRFSGAG